MSKSDNYWVTPHPDGWQVKREGSQRASSVHDTKADALVAGRDLAKQSEGELRITDRHGVLRDSDTYAPRDPFPPRDRKH